MFYTFEMCECITVRHENDRRAGIAESPAQTEIVEKEKPGVPGFIKSFQLKTTEK